MARTNPNGDWKKARELRKKYLETAKQIQNALKGLAKMTKEMDLLSVDLFHVLPEFDVLFGDSPLNPRKFQYHQKAFLKKLGMPGVDGVLTPEINIKDFYQEAEEATNWAFKFEKKDEADS